MPIDGDHVLIMVRASPAQQLWLDVAHALQPSPDRVTKARAQRPAANEQPVSQQLELRMAPKPIPHIEPRPPAIVAAPADMAAKPTSPSFAVWLRGQTKRSGLLGDLAKAAQGDRLFPKTGSADDVRARFSAAGADGDAFEALDYAEREFDRQMSAA